MAEHDSSTSETSTPDPLEERAQDLGLQIQPDGNAEDDGLERRPEDGQLPSDADVQAERQSEGVEGEYTESPAED